MNGTDTVDGLYPSEKLALLGLWVIIAYDAVAHLGNYVGVETSLALFSFPYGSPVYELFWTGYWLIGLLAVSYVLYGRVDVRGWVSQWYQICKAVVIMLWLIGVGIYTTLRHRDEWREMATAHEECEDCRPRDGQLCTEHQDDLQEVIEEVQ